MYVYVRTYVRIDCAVLRFPFSLYSCATNKLNIQILCKSKFKEEKNDCKVPHLLPKVRQHSRAIKEEEEEKKCLRLDSRQSRTADQTNNFVVRYIEIINQKWIVFSLYTNTFRCRSFSHIILLKWRDKFCHLFHHHTASITVMIMLVNYHTCAKI